MVTTGGTIASVGSGASGAPRAALSPELLLEPVGVVPTLDVGPVVELARRGSWDVDPVLMWRIAAQLRELVADPAVDGVVVTHGTDTVEESAFLADIAVPSGKPVVFTAAMRPADALSADGPHNLRAALLAAGCPELADLGVTVCLGDGLHAARWVRKTHTQRLHALDSGDHGPVATVDPDGGVRTRCTALARYHVELSGDVRGDDVVVVAAYTGMGAGVIDAVVSHSGARGVVIEGFGLGHVPAAVAETLPALVARGIPVVIATRVPGGGVWPVYGGTGGGVDLAAAGVLGAGELSAAKARLLLLACLAGADGPAAARRFAEAVAVLGGRPATS